jgi:hypothetical protein
MLRLSESDEGVRRNEIAKVENLTLVASVPDDTDAILLDVSSESQPDALD